ncbi:MAG: glycosyltransferase [Piscinibacter sp.]|nr:glycosyltransferase [Piscinibacter sp.]
MLAFHFPPLKGSSGLERVLAFCRHLPRAAWRPVVLSAHPRAYDAVSDERMGDIPAGVPVARAFALDTARHLSVRGRYPRWTALPDRWIAWLIGAVPRGWLLAREYRPAAIWSTYPIATAHIVGWLLSRLTGLPWVADFRDPMVEVDSRTGLTHPTDPGLRRARLWVESLVARRAAAAVFCTRDAADIFAGRYPFVPPERIHVIANGYDEGAFATASAAAPGDPRQLVLLHSGLLYPGPDRDPGAFLQGLRAFLDAQPRWQGRLRVVLRASGFDAQYRPIIEQLGLANCVQLAPPTPYREALGEMLGADGLLVFQGHPSNPAIPAKLYEYLRARRPIFALVDDQGSTAALLREEGVGMLAPIDDAGAIERRLSDFLAAVESGGVPVLTEDRARRFERGERAIELARLLDRVAARPAVGAGG